jgi:16S rRNA U516 pseudouridylate synthase RsuA-like enzyme
VSEGIELGDLELPMRLMEHMHAETSSVTNNLIEGYQRTIKDMEDAINATLTRMDRIITDDFAPSTNALIRALMPLRVYER